jgi:hypothetical protein
MLGSGCQERSQEKQRNSPLGVPRQLISIESAKLEDRPE